MVQITQGKEVRYAAISASNGADQSIVAAVTGKRIVVVSYVLTLDAAGEYFFESSTTTALGGAVELAADSPCGLSCAFGVFATAAGEALTLTTTQPANGHLTYFIE